jgi:hypothetical protein
MSYIARMPPPEPDRDPMRIVMEELSDVFAIMEILSLRLARLEAQQHGDRLQTRSEGPS